MASGRFGPRVARLSRIAAGPLTGSDPVSVKSACRSVHTFIPLGHVLLRPSSHRSGRAWQDRVAVETMRAVRKVGPEPGLVLDEVPVPTPSPDEVLVRIEAASICGTDLHIRRWDQWSSERVKPPLTLGHELCGTITAVGSGVQDLTEGDYVSAESHVTCGVCFHCRTGRAHMCERTQILGVDRDGGFADYAAMPASVVWKNDRTKIPPHLACLQEP